MRERFRGEGKNHARHHLLSWTRSGGSFPAVLLGTSLTFDNARMTLW